MTWSNPTITNRFLHAAGLTAAAVILSANLAMAHDGHSHPAPSFNFDPQILCGDSKGLHAAESPCYSIFAKEMTDYAQNAAAQYLGAPNLDAALALIQQNNPTSVEVDREKNVIKARWQDGQQRLHRDSHPAYIKIDLTKKTYTEMWFQHGEFSRSAYMPTYMKYTPGERIKLQWDKGNAGMDNRKGPALAENNLTTLQMILRWAVNGVPGNPIDPKGGPTYAEIDLSSNIAYFQEFQSGDGVGQQRMHRHDCVHTLSRDRQTGAIAEIVYHYHDRDFDTDDEIAVRIIFDPSNGEVLDRQWTKNDQPMDPPAKFNLPLNHYCQDPGHSHPAAKYQ